MQGGENMKCDTYRGTLKKKAINSSETLVIKDYTHSVINQKTTIQTMYFVRRLLL
jgi:hypothetical protein